MQSKDKVALFDFCETIANFQTADAYVKYVREKSGSRKMQIKERIRTALKKTKAIDILELLFRRASINKRLVLWQLKGYDKSYLETCAAAYYNDVIKNNLIMVVIDELKRLQAENWRIVIVSAGYEIYLKYFCDDFSIGRENLIAVKIKFSGNKCLGTFDGGDRLWDKTKKLDSFFDKERIQSIAYSDSITDLPLLQWANQGVVVRRNDKKNWSSKYKLKEIVWQRK